jgi:hypothetical protein
MSDKRPSYASSAVVRRAIAAIETTGSIVTTVRLLPNGAIECIIADASNDDGKHSEFDRLEAAGLL